MRLVARYEKTNH